MICPCPLRLLCFLLVFRLWPIVPGEMLPLPPDRHSKCMTWPGWSSYRARPATQRPSELSSLQQPRQCSVKADTMPDHTMYLLLHEAHVPSRTPSTPIHPPSAVSSSPPPSIRSIHDPPPPLGPPPTSSSSSNSGSMQGPHMRRAPCADACPRGRRGSGARWARLEGVRA